MFVYLFMYLFLYFLKFILSIFWRTTLEASMLMCALMCLSSVNIIFICIIMFYQINSTRSLVRSFARSLVRSLARSLTHSHEGLLFCLEYIEGLCYRLHHDSILNQKACLSWVQSETQISVIKTVSQHPDFLSQY